MSVLAFLPFSCFLSPFFWLSLSLFLAFSPFSLLSLSFFLAFSLPSPRLLSPFSSAFS